jgi:hypothetical protein
MISCNLETNANYLQGNNFSISTHAEKTQIKHVGPTTPDLVVSQAPSTAQTREKI